MINALSLAWIVPAVFFCGALFGFVIAALAKASGAASRREEKWE